MSKLICKNSALLNARIEYSWKIYIKPAKRTEEMPINLNEMTQNNVVLSRGKYSAFLCGKTTNFYYYVTSGKGWCFKI